MRTSQAAAGIFLRAFCYPSVAPAMIADMKTHPVVILLFSLCLAIPTFGAPAPKPRPRPNPEAEALARELSRFPDVETCRAYIAVGEEHLRWIDGRIALLPFEREAWTEYRGQVEGCLELWRAIKSAQESVAWSHSWCRDRLDRVREGIVEEAYEWGYLAPPFAVHAMPRWE